MKHTLADFVTCHQDTSNVYNQKTKMHKRQRTHPIDKLVSSDVKLCIVSYLPAVDVMTSLLCVSHAWHSLRCSERTCRILYQGLYTLPGRDDISRAISQIEAAAFDVKHDEWTWKKRLECRWTAQRHLAMDEFKPIRKVMKPTPASCGRTWNRRTHDAHIVGGILYGTTCLVDPRRQVEYSVEKTDVDLRNRTLESTTPSKRPLGINIYIQNTLGNPCHAIGETKNELAIFDTTSSKIIASVPKPWNATIDIAQNRIMVRSDVTSPIVEYLDASTLRVDAKCQLPYNIKHESTLIDGYCYEITRGHIENLFVISCYDVRTGKSVQSTTIHLAEKDYALMTTTIRHVFVRGWCQLKVLRRSDLQEIQEIKTSGFCRIHSSPCRTSPIITEYDTQYKWQMIGDRLARCSTSNFNVGLIAHDARYVVMQTIMSELVVEDYA